VESKDQTPQSPALNYREGPRRIGVFVCLIGILVGGAGGELLRESMVADLHRHTSFAAVLNSPEVQKAIETRNAEPPGDGEMVHVESQWITDLRWEDGRVAYFVLGDGSFFFDSPRPPAWAFPLVLLCPVMGFLIPWAAMKALSLAGVGYFAKKPTAPAKVTT